MLEGLETIFLHFPDIQILEIFNVILRSLLNRVRASDIKSNQNKIYKNNVYKQWSGSALL